MIPTKRPQQATSTRPTPVISVELLKNNSSKPMKISDVLAKSNHYRSESTHDLSRAPTKSTAATHTKQLPQLRMHQHKSSASILENAASLPNLQSREIKHDNYQ